MKGIRNTLLHNSILACGAGIFVLIVLQAHASLLSSSTDKPALVAATSAGITPHRALYSIKLSGTRNGSNVSDISGRMLFSWSDDCHAWNIEQKIQTRFFYSEGEVSDTTSNLVSRESKDGSSFNFHTSHTGGDKNSTYHGYANLTIGDDGLGAGEAVYSGDDEKHIRLSGAIFPAHHTLQLLAHARNGERIFSVNVFDGGDEKGFSEISSFISPPLAPHPIIEKASAGKDDTLTQVKAWPIRMAFFSSNSETGSPDYEMDMVLLDNGIIKTMTIDYGEYSMTADLVDVKPIAAPKCTSDKKVPHS